MLDGDEFGTFQTRGLLTGIFNRLGNGGTPLTCNPPAWITPKQVHDARNDLDLARAAFKQFVGSGKAGG